VASICAALGLTMADLFFGSPLPKGQLLARRAVKVDSRSIALHFDIHGTLLRERAEAVLRAATNHDTTTWSGFDFDAALNAVAQAYHDREHARVLFDVADNLRGKAFAQENRK
jgi:hypothetical protein